jgi:hypothetical protein
MGTSATPPAKPLIVIAPSKPYTASESIGKHTNVATAVRAITISTPEHLIMDDFEKVIVLSSLFSPEFFRKGFLDYQIQHTSEADEKPR